MSIVFTVAELHLPSVQLASFPLCLLWPGLVPVLLSVRSQAMGLKFGDISNQTLCLPSAHLCCPREVFTGGQGWWVRCPPSVCMLGL